MYVKTSITPAKESPRQGERERGQMFSEAVKTVVLRFVEIRRSQQGQEEEEEDNNGTAISSSRWRRQILGGGGGIDDDMTSYEKEQQAGGAGDGGAGVGVGVVDFAGSIGENVLRAVENEVFDQIASKVKGEGGKQPDTVQ